MPNGPVIRARTPAEERADRIRAATGLWGYRDPRPKPGRPTIRAATRLERLNDWLLSIYESAAAQPLGRMTDALGLTDLAGMVDSALNPPVLQTGEVTPPEVRVGRWRGVPAEFKPGGQSLGTLARTLRRGEAAGVYDLRDPTGERVRDLYRLGRALPTASNWAGSQSDELLEAFGGDAEAALRWARLWGATSPNTSVPVNTRESVSALAYALEHPNYALDERTGADAP